MILTIQRARLCRDACAACAVVPDESNALWCTLHNNQSERLFNLCPSCSSTLAHSYLKQLQQQQAGQNNPPKVGPAGTPPFMLRPSGDRRRRGRY